MWSKLSKYMVLAFLLNFRVLEAQQVLYSPPINDRSTLRFTIAGKAGSFYWVQKERRKRSALKKAAWPLNEEQSFDIYDQQMNLVNSVASYNITDFTLKEYLVPGDRYFDELILSAANQETQLILKRYSQQGDTTISDRLIGELPFVEQGNRFLLVRSEDRQKILLLGFESVLSSPPRLHAIMFDAAWNQLYRSVYEHPYFSQPFIQDDFISNPIEHFNGAPVQVANNGQWLMASPSRTSYNFLLFHFKAMDSAMSSREIILPPSYSMEDVALYIDNEKEEAFAGILSGFRHNTHKNVHITHYAMQSQQFDFDSSYRFNTLPAGKMKNENITKEAFMAVPGKGFVLLKEYGRNFAGWYENEYFDNNWDPDVLFANHDATHPQVIFSNGQEGYTRYNSLNGIRENFNRGDLNLFYFPAHSQDSCWSGIVSKEQTTELNAPALSYLVMPIKNRLFLLYNSFLRNNDQYGSSTILDAQGNLQNSEGVIYWKFNTTLSFQQSIQISENEVAVPYDKNQRRGFAVIRF